jgi:streptogramin lyase
MLRRTPLFAAALSLTAAALPAQTVTTVPLGISIPTENSHAVTGVSIRALPDGTVWFMVPSNDRIVRLQGSTLTQWQIRTDKKIGANPVDFQFDGDVIWFICNGESQIDAGRSIFARLDTTTGALREWVLPGSKPAGFWRAPDGKVWIPQSDGRLQSLDLQTLQVNDYKSRSADGKVFTFAYSDLAYGPDGALWMTDFGNNRIVRYEPGADSETSWTFFDPSAGRLNPSQIRFDQAGHLWICQRSGFRIDEFDPSTNFLASFPGFTSPIHFELFQGRIYVAEAFNGNGVVAVLDPNLATVGGVVLTPLTVPVRHIVNAKPALIRDSTITPTTFVSKTNGFGASDLTVTAGAAGTGILSTSFANRNAYGITVADGYVWTGSDGGIVRLLLQNIGEDENLAVPIAFQSAADAPPLDRVDVTLANQGDSTISGDLLFLYSPASFAASVPFAVNPRSTAVLTDVFHNVQSPGVFITGPVRIRVTGGTMADLTASVRSVSVREDGANFGFALPAVDTYGGLGLGERATLFTAARDAETATLGLYTSSAGAGAQPGTLTLVAADGTVRATLDYNLANNTLEEFTPPASAFGLPAQDGDVVRINAGPGSLRAYVRFVDSGSADSAMSLPVKASGDAVLPFVATGVAQDGTGPVSDLYLSNPDPGSPAHVTVSFFAGGPPAAPAQAAVALPPGSATVLRDVLNSLLGLSSGSGALVVTSDIPVASAARLAARRSDGDYATVIAAYDGSQSVPAGASAFASGLQEIPNMRSTDLVLFNRGAATTATVVGFDGNGSEINRLTVALGAGESRLLTAVLHQLGLDGPGEIDNARVRVDALAGSQIYAAFAQTDALSGDAEWTRPR